MILTTSELALILKEVLQDIKSTQDLGVLNDEPYYFPVPLQKKLDLIESVKFYNLIDHFEEVSKDFLLDNPNALNSLNIINLYIDENAEYLNSFLN